MAAPNTAQQLNVGWRPKLEEEIGILLAQLDPQGEIGGTMLGRYYSWQQVEDVPAEMLANVHKSLAQDVRIRETLGDEKYFANLTARQKLDLNLRACTLLKTLMDNGALNPDKPITFRDWDAQRQACLRAASPWPDGTEAKLFDLTSDEPPKAKKKKRWAGPAAFKKPTAEEVRAYCQQMGYGHVRPEEFVDHYESNGWRVGGKSPMRNWKAALRQWARRHFGASSQPPEKRITGGRPENMLPENDPMDVTEYIPLKEKEKRA